MMRLKWLVVVSAAGWLSGALPLGCTRQRDPESPRPALSVDAGAQSTAAAPVTLQCAGAGEISEFASTTAAPYDSPPRRAIVLCVPNHEDVANLCRQIWQRFDQKSKATSTV